ncbi:MAG: hypothetical protein KGI33_08925 [Thaumarchaeota archaeon]|nr:hypothetical protein [Nitrososphaerota archaeon]
MISLPVGVRVVKFYDAEMKKAGKGILYLLSNGIMFEKKGEGAKFECNFDYLASFEAVKKDKLRVMARTQQGPRPVEFKVDPAKQVEYDISQVNKEYADSASSGASKNIERQEKFDQDAHSRLEAKWFKENWEQIMKFLRQERVSYLNEYVKNAKTGSPNVDPYVLLVTYEDLTYKDFADLTGFLKWRYSDIMDKEVNAISSVFQNFGVDFSVGMLDMDVQMCKPLEPNFKKKGYTLYQFVATVAREKLESAKLSESQQISPSSQK